MAVGKVSDASFESDVLKSAEPVVVDFWAEWCGPCRMIAPALEEIAGQLGDKVKIVKLNVDENPNVSFKFQIRGIPTLLLFKGGQVVESVVGLAGKDELKQVLAHSTISQYGYVLTLYGIGGPAGASAAALYVITHGIAKSALFMTAGAVTMATGEDRLSRIGGLRKQMPLLATASGVAAATLAMSKASRTGRPVAPPERLNPSTQAAVAAVSVVTMLRVRARAGMWGPATSHGMRMSAVSVVPWPQSWPP